MTSATSLELLICIIFGLAVFGHEVIEVLRMRRRIATNGMREGDLLRNTRYMQARTLVAATAAVMVILLSLIALR